MDINRGHVLNEQLRKSIPPPLPTQGGYDVGDTTVYNSSGAKMSQNDILALECPICLKMLRNPIQLITCGCRYCTTCIDKLLENNSDSSSLKCPVDSTPFSRKHVRKDKGCVKEINGLQVDCPTQPTPCNWRGGIVQVEDHVRSVCPNVDILCNLGCGVVFSRCQHQQHALECMKRSTVCSYCAESITKDELEKHIKDICSESPMVCDFCREKLEKRCQFQKHLEDDCTQYEMDCPMSKLIGCDYKGKRLEMVKHSQQHTIVMFEKVATLCVTMESITSQNTQLAQALKDKDDLNTRLDDRVRNLEKFIRHGVEMPDAVDADGMGPSLVKGGNSKVRSKGVVGRRRVEADGAPSIESRRLGSLIETAENNKVQLMQLSENIQMIQENMTQHNIALDELRLRQDILDVRTTNGVFIWKIPDIRRRYREAIDRRTVSIYSPPYFTSPQGYRMCTRVYLHGDGMGKGTHISVFFVLMRSEHDNLLQWPFKQSVRFTLINQVNSSGSITEAFAPDLQSPSFKQPENEMNIASGFPKFAKQSVLQDENFTKGNTIFIKAQVDLSGLAVY